MEIENKYPFGPTSGYLTEKFDERVIYNAIDMNKAYPDCLRKIKTVPVFGYFDEYKEYDNHKIEPYTMYLVETPLNQADVSKVILFPTVYHRCFGFKLLHSTGINYKIHAFRRPSDLEDVDFQEPMNQLFENKKLSSIHKKFIANKTTGLCEKKYNTANITRVFDSYEEAYYYQNKYMKYNGKIHVLQQTYKSTEKISNSPLDFGIDVIEEDKEVTKLTYGKKIYLLIIEKKEALIDGYRYIKELIYDMMSIKMYDLFNEIVAKGIKPKGIKTDAILISKSKSELEKLFTFDNEMGGIKFESGKQCLNKKIIQLTNEPFNVKDQVINEIKIINEYDKNEFKTIFDNHSRIMIEGVFPGVGKTTSVLSYEGHNILFVPQ